ncbi:LuxR family transcriptional regulator, maltose regulon positive regulatory protein [Aquisalimonas asiatica]|uniref:LuxR family transcriptional regulator, maltose regulon positive regulatory protein n=2 Tax=Aquisalimonas asiatica TaxID=406100 RepID=A0A1H8S7N7_9GAMM|nr:LuxR family transcriptional regulator, maltose regulon positive regulatory protein [Aquisalimonas asiatica]
MQALDVPPTVLRPPQSGVELISRPHVFKTITDLPPGCMVKVMAPAGAGKTTVLSQAYERLRRDEVAVAWLSVTSLANDFHRFMLQLIAAVRTAKPDFAATLPSLLESTTSRMYQDLAMKLALAFAHGVDRRLVVFVDDYHCIDLPVIHQTLAMLLDHLPPQVSLVVGSRTEPDFPLGAMRASGRLVELGWNELRFSRDEAARLFQLRGCDLSASQLQSVYDQTEGWATGLQLASLDLGADDTLRAGDQPLTRQAHVTDYWLDAVLRRLSPKLQDFLLRTSVLDGMSPGLCDAICDTDDSAAVLQELERLNLFTFRLDDVQVWFRYHHLFREFLYTRLRDRHPQQMDALHLAASQWFEQEGALAEAIDFALRGNDPERAAVLLVPYGRALFRSGRFKELRLSLEQLPESELTASAELCILNGWSYAYGGEFGRAHAWAEAGAEAALHEPKRAAFEGEIAVLLSTLGVIQNDEPNRTSLHPGLMEQLEHTDSSVQAFAHIALGYAYRSDGRLADAGHEIAEAIRFAERNECSLINMLARYNHVALALLRGEREVAENSARGSLQIATERHWTEGMGAAFVRTQLGAVLYEANRIDDALTELDAAVAILRATEAYGFLGVALLMRARALWAGGRMDAAASDLRDAGEIGESRQVERVRFKKALLEARMALADGRMARARRHLDRARSQVREPGAGEAWSEHFEQLKLVEARAAVASQDWHAVSAELAIIATSARDAGRWYHWLEAQALTVEVSLAQEEADSAADAVLTEALAFAAEESLWRPFFHVGPRLRARVALLAKRGSVRGAAELDAALGAPRLAAARSRCEPLHARETQILALVAEGVKNREIGARLFISEETVKWYLKSLYRKLDVENRTAAVARARELGLMEEA